MLFHFSEEAGTDTFECINDCAGYFVSGKPVRPAHVEVLDDLIGELLERGVELRFVPNLWPLHDAVVASTLQFSSIRMRNVLGAHQFTVISDLYSNDNEQGDSENK